MQHIKRFRHVLLFGIAAALCLTGVTLLNSQTTNIIPPRAAPTKSPHGKSPHDNAAAPKEVTVPVFVFNREGRLVGPVTSPKFELTDEQWQRRLTPDEFAVTRGKGTERAFCGNLLDNKLEGVYACVCCGLPLFASNSKFNSGTGWPSFFQPINEANVAKERDGNPRFGTEILCARCDAHLGHVFDDGPKPTGLRFCLNSAALKFTGHDQLATLADPLADKAPKAADEKQGAGAAQPASQTQAGETPAGGSETNAAGSAESKQATAVFASGCFWCSEAAFEQVAGVSSVESGYSGGAKATANYEQVSTGQTGHAEAIRIVYDPAKVSYAQLLDVFFDSHDPTQVDGQGVDHGTQYRSAIFYSSEEQRKAAEAKIQKLDAAHVHRRKIATTLEPLIGFTPAEDYHQDYAANNPFAPYIRQHSAPNAARVRNKHPELMKKASGK